MHDKEKDLETGVTEQDILDFIEWNVQDDCDNCLGNNWSLEGGTQEKSVTLRIEQDSDRRECYIDCFALICINCGYVKTFAKHAVKLWKQKKESKHRETKASEEPSRPIWVNIILHNGKHIEIPIMLKSIVRVSAINQFEPHSLLSPFRSKIELIDGRVFEVIEDCDVIKQKIEYARRDRDS